MFYSLNFNNFHSFKDAINYDFNKKDGTIIPFDKLNTGAKASFPTSAFAYVFPIE